MADRPPIEGVPAETSGVIVHGTDEVTALRPHDEDGFRDFYDVRTEYCPGERAIVDAVDPAEPVVEVRPNRYGTTDTTVSRSP